MRKAWDSNQRRPHSVKRQGLPESLPTFVQKSYFMLGTKERDVLNLALSKYRADRSEPILIGGATALKPALQLMNVYRLRIDEIKEDAVVTSYTRWLEAVIVKGTENQEVYVTFSPLFERIWLESKKHLPEHVAKEPGNIGLRSQYSIRLYAWAKKYASVGKKRISLEDLRKVLGLEPLKDAENNTIQEPPLSLWANFRQRALDIAILGINSKTDLKIAIESLERSKHRRVTAVTFSIEERAIHDCTCETMFRPSTLAFLCRADEGEVGRQIQTQA
jgi:Initiator Replication protein